MLQGIVSEKFGNAISAYYISEDDFKRRRKEPLIKQVSRKYVLICSKPLGEDYVSKS
ncbi:MAG: hypothetical protein QXR97_01510 [Thermoproteota archaeon]